MRFQSRCIRLFSVVGLVLAGTGLAPAKTPYDGAWAVTIMTEKGSCDPAFRYAVLVSDGSITYDARENSGLVAISGKVDRQGQVRVNLSRGEQQANGNGKLSENGGAGTWIGKSSAASCAGRWEAKRN